MEGEVCRDEGCKSVLVFLRDTSKGRTVAEMERGGSQAQLRQRSHKFERRDLLRLLPKARCVDLLVDGGRHSLPWDYAPKNITKRPCNRVPPRHPGMVRDDTRDLSTFLLALLFPPYSTVFQGARLPLDFKLTATDKKKILKNRPHMMSE